MTDSEAIAHREEWYSYYSEKRIVHQWFQVKLLETLPVRKILEIGPALGVPTALLASAGFDVTTLDIEERDLLGASHHIVADLQTVDPDRLSGFDCILCCEVLEHFPFDISCEILARLAQSRVAYLIMSVPYQAPQLWFSVYLNGVTARKTTSLQFRNGFRNFCKQAPGGHQWEIGYRGFPLSRLESEVANAGWQIEERHFTSGTRSVFLVAKNQS